jgi:hypothetical protein
MLRDRRRCVGIRYYVAVDIEILVIVVIDLLRCASASFSSRLGATVRGAPDSPVRSGGSFPSDEKVGREVTRGKL